MVKFFLSIAFALIASCAGAATTPAIDYNGNPLPGNPQITLINGQPTSVNVAGINVRVYSYGTAPAPMSTFGTILRDCKSMLPGMTSCYHSNPFEYNLTEQDICGFPAIPAIIIACKDGSCTSEIYQYSCGLSYPDAQRSPQTATYSAPFSSQNVVGVIDRPSDFVNQQIPSRFDFTATPMMALQIKAQGRTPILAFGSTLFDYDGRIKIDAAQILDGLITRFPTVYGPGAIIEVIDEPFWGHVNVSDTEKVSSINYAIALIRSRIPNAQLGVVIAPVWRQQPSMITDINSIAPNLDWISTDPYMGNLGDHALMGSLANEFVSYVNGNYPHLKTWLIVQGFGPTSAKKPSEWGQSEINLFTQYLVEMSNASKRYTGVVVWGWNNVSELDEGFAGKYFPQVIKDMFFNALK